MFKTHFNEIFEIMQKFKNSKDRYFRNQYANFQYAVDDWVQKE